MRGYFNRWLAGLMLCVFVASNAMAAAVPAFNGRANTAVGSLINSKLGKWGFAANDPRISATSSGVSSALTTLAVGVATGGVAAVGWPALLVGAGVAAVVGGAIDLGVGAATKWLFGSDGNVTVSGAPSSLPGAVAAQPGHTLFRASAYNGTIVEGSDPNDVAATVAMYAQCGAPTCSINPVTHFSGSYNAAGNSYNITPYQTTSGGVVFDRGVVLVAVVGAPTPGAQPAVSPSGASGPVTKTLNEAIAAIPDADAAKPASDELLAAAANASWKQMAPNSGGLPWSASDPITPADVAVWRQQNPSAVPTVSDFIAPVAPQGGSAVNIAPTTSTVTGPAPTPGQGTQIDLGPNPNIAAPTLEATPSASSILSPILNLMPELRSFSVPVHQSECPVASFEALGSHYSMSSHCTLIEQNRALLEGAMLLVWTLASVFIVLRA